MTSAKISPEKRREYWRAYRVKHREKLESAEYRAYKAGLERQRRQTPEYKEYIKFYWQKRGVTDGKRDRHVKSSLQSEYTAFRRRRLLHSIIVLERFWAGEHYEFPFGIGHHFGVPPEDLGSLINGRQSIFVKRFLDEPFTGAGIYSELIEELRWRANQENMEIERSKEILATRVAKEKQQQRSSVEHYLRRQKEYLDTRIAHLEKEKQAFYEREFPANR